VHTPNVHLHALNPQLDEADMTQLAFCTETLRYKTDTTYNSVTGRGFGGSIVSVIVYNEAKEKPVSESKLLQLEEAPIAFWPGGGGELEEEALPERTYTIVGSWTAYSQPADMQWEGDGKYGYTVTLSENRYEHFQIWLDGDPGRVLHPGCEHAPKGFSAVFSIHAGIDEDSDGQSAGAAVEEDGSGAGAAVEEDGSEGCYWLLDGRDQEVAVQDPDTGEALMLHRIDSVEGRPLLKEDQGAPGDRYRIYLHVAGKHRMVDWEKMPRRPVPEEVLPSPAQYHVATSSTSWSFQPMEQILPGSFQLDIVLEEDTEEFQIVRDGDWSQVFWPGASEGEVAGPDFGAMSFGGWKLEGKLGDKFRIEFQRICDQGVDKKRISMTKIQ